MNTFANVPNSCSSNNIYKLFFKWIVSISIKQ